MNTRDTTEASQVKDHTKPLSTNAAYRHLTKTKFKNKVGPSREIRPISLSIPGTRQHIQQTEWILRECPTPTTVPINKIGAMPITIIFTQMFYAKNDKIALFTVPGTVPRFLQREP